MNDLQFRKEGKMRDQRGGHIAQKPADRAFHGFARTDARREPPSPHRAPSVIGPRISGKDDYEKQRQQLRRKLRYIVALDHANRDDVPAEDGDVQHAENPYRRLRQRLAEVFILPASKKLRDDFNDADRRDDRDNQLTLFKIKSGERRRRRRQPLNFSAARGQPVILIKPDQDARGGDRRKPDRPPQPEGGEENRQKDDCAKNSSHRGSGEWGVGRGESMLALPPHSPFPTPQHYEPLTTAIIAASFKPPNRRSRF